MATTAIQKLAALCMPAAAFGLAVATADPSWSPRREHYGTWRETMERAAAEKARKDAPVAPTVPVVVPVPVPVPAPVEKTLVPENPAPVGKKDPTPEPKPALPQPEGIEFKVSGLAPCRSAGPLKHPAADRLDVTVAVSGAYKVGVNFADKDTVEAAIASAPAAQKKDGLLFVVPNVRSPWDDLKGILVAGASADWSRIGIAVAHPDSLGLGRVLAVQVPAGAVEVPKGMDPMIVKVGAGPNPSFTLNGEECKDAAALEAKAKALHEECELMLEAYTADLGKTPWSVDGTGAMVGGVVAALDALNAAGVKTARIVGVQRPKAEQPAEEKKAEPEPVPPVPEDDKK